MSNVKMLSGDFRTVLLPFVEGNKVQAGFPSPAQDYVEQRIEVLETLVRDPDATFVCEVQGDSLIGVGIMPKAKLIVEKGIPIVDGRIGIFEINGEFTAKIYRKQHGRVWLEAANPKYPNIEIGSEDTLILWGVVIHSINSY